MTAERPTLGAYFGAEDDESAVLTIVAFRDGEREPWRLAFGTLLIVPSKCAQLSWAEWQVHEEHRFAERYEPPFPPAHRASGDDWLIARSPLAIAEAESWFEALRALPSEGGQLRLPEIGEIPELVAALSPPTMPLHVVPSVRSPGASLISGLGRPVRGLHWRSMQHPPRTVPDVHRDEGRFLSSPARHLAGMHISHGTTDPATTTAPGLLVGRAERTAWIHKSGGSGDFTSYEIEVRWDPSRIDGRDLEVTHVERFERETVQSTRVMLEDVVATADLANGTCRLLLPTMGRKLSHEVLLHSVEGEFFDRNGPWMLLEQIHSTMTVNGAQQPTQIIGITDPLPDLDERLVRQRQIDEETSARLLASAQGRFLSQRESARARLIDAISSAHDELLIMDRYFGQHTDDWELLEHLVVPARVLVGKLPQDDNKRVRPVPVASNVRVRHRPKAPIHDRIYLWTGGGLSVGGSPTSFGQAPIRIDRLQPRDVQLWRDEFEALWASTFFKDVPRTAR